MRREIRNAIRSANSYARMIDTETNDAKRAEYIAKWQSYVNYVRRADPQLDITDYIVCPETL